MFPLVDQEATAFSGLSAQLKMAGDGSGGGSLVLGKKLVLLERAKRSGSLVFLLRSSKDLE